MTEMTQSKVTITVRPETSVAGEGILSRRRDGGTHEYEPNQSLGRTPTRRRRRGFTLIEILVVVAILGLIGGIVGVAVGNAFDDTSIKTAELQIKKFSEALDLYRIKYGRYPTTAEGLQMLEKPPGNKPGLIESIPKDPWNNDYLYISPGQRNPAKYDLQSKGKDGAADTDDDIKS
ncbi:MAG: type II secretion system major pseudopilin GspG [Deltaproteobacteria bacterium]|nr:type II secretion system major pseudopilin GspG [Deltaproteobacteria bacterium]